MKLVLQLSDVSAEAATVSGVVRVDDQSEADAPARAMGAHAFGPMPLDPGVRSFTVTLPDGLVVAGAHLNVRAEVRDAAGHSARFLNTSAIQVTPSRSAAISAELDRI